MTLDRDAFSRPARLAATLTERTEEESANLFLEKSIMIRLEPDFARIADARETFLFAVNQVLRFCPNVGLQVPPEAQDLIDSSVELARAIHGGGAWIQVIASERKAADFDAIINVGTRIVEKLPWITVNSDGWLARVASAYSGVNVLPWSSAPANACGALAAACLGAGSAFLTMLGHPPSIAQEISLFTRQEGNLGTLHEGPALPSRSLEMDALLVGCGAVTNGWAYTIKRLPIIGSLQAIDRQSLRIENLGPYVLATRALVETSKSQIIGEYLAPAITVTPRPEEWELFKIRLKYGVVLPTLVVNGLDHVGTRHSVQRLWPEVLVDMAAGGLTSQVIVKPAATDALCLLQALDVPPGELDWAERLAQETGLNPDRIRNEPVTEITQADIDGADPTHRGELEKSRGKLICGRVTDQNLTMEAHNADFAPAVPFVTAFSGVVGAAESVKQLMGLSASLHYQHHFQSNRSRALQMQCLPDCECNYRAGACKC
jgi:hypothetical protein